MLSVNAMKAMDILLVEDSPSDVFITKEALKRTVGNGNLHIVHDGVEAIAFLRKQGDYFDAPCPDLILLDLNMPRKDGREVLAEIKTDEKFKCIPVIVLTSSSAEQDVSKAYELHANCYITKPTDFSKFKEVLKAIETFWFKNVTLPPHGP
jgi:two-component system, chemotaxis family, response regulator Rcp1